MGKKRKRINLETCGFLQNIVNKLQSLSQQPVYSLVVTLQLEALPKTVSRFLVTLFFYVNLGIENSIRYLGNGMFLPCSFAKYTKTQARKMKVHLI